MTETPFESPVEDAVEQRAEILPEADREGTARTWTEPVWEADPADAQEQDAEVPIDEDEWR
jgi:hypothetical protein